MSCIVLAHPLKRAKNIVPLDLCSSWSILKKRAASSAITKWGANSVRFFLWKNTEHSRSLWKLLCDQLKNESLNARRETPSASFSSLNMLCLNMAWNSRQFNYILAREGQEEGWFQSRDPGSIDTSEANASFTQILVLRRRFGNRLAQWLSQDFPGRVFRLSKDV